MMMLWYWERYRDDRRRQRRMTRGLYPSDTGRTILALALLLASIALWVFAFPHALAEAGDSYTVSTTGDTLNIRKNPWVGAEVIGRLYPGDTVTLVSEGDGWSLVTAPIEAGQGYVKSDYLTLVLPDRPVGEYRNSSGGRARVRTQPDGKRVRWLEKDETVNVTRWTSLDGDLWAYVGDGYVLGSCLEEEIP